MRIGQHTVPYFNCTLHSSHVSDFNCATKRSPYHNQMLTFSAAVFGVKTRNMKDERDLQIEGLHQDIIGDECYYSRPLSACIQNLSILSRSLVMYLGILLLHLSLSPRGMLAFTSPRILNFCAYYERGRYLSCRAEN